MGNVWAVFSFGLFAAIAALVGPAKAADYYTCIPQTQPLYAGDALHTVDGQLHFVMQTDGNLVLYDDDRIFCVAGIGPCTNKKVVLWAMGGNYNAATPNHFQQLSDGTLAVFNRNGARIWMTSYPGTGPIPSEPFQFCIERHATKTVETGALYTQRLEGSAWVTYNTFFSYGY